MPIALGFLRARFRCVLSERAGAHEPPGAANQPRPKALVPRGAGAFIAINRVPGFRTLAKAVDQSMSYRIHPIIACFSRP